MRIKHVFDGTRFHAAFGVEEHIVVWANPCISDFIGWRLARVWEVAHTRGWSVVNF